MAGRSPKKKKRGVIAIVIFIIIVLAALAMLGMLFINGMLNKVERTDTVPQDVVAASAEFFDADSSAGSDTIEASTIEFDLDTIQPMEDHEVKNILLIGQDRRKGEGRQRSDSMIICSLNKNTNQIVLTSLMRDMYVPIPGYSNNRINVAYVYGGMDLLDRVIEEDFGVKIDGNVEVDFEGFIESLSVVGNLDIELTSAEASYLNSEDWSQQGSNSGNWHLKPGVNSLTPEQALAYSRTRNVGNSDYERTERQRKVIMAAFNKLKGSDVATMVETASAIIPNLTTDMSNTDLLGFVKTIAMDDMDISSSYRIPVDGTFHSETIHGMAVLVPDLEQNSSYLKQYIYGEMEAESVE